MAASDLQANRNASMVTLAVGKEIASKYLLELEFDRETGAADLKAVPKADVAPARYSKIESTRTKPETPRKSLLDSALQ